MNYPQILSPVLNFLHCPTPQAWIVQARDPQNLPLLLTDHLICELKAAQTALLLVRKYVADKSGADALLSWLQPYEAFAFRQGRSRILLPCINRLAKAPCRKLMTPGDVSLSTVWCY
ncbi:tRNA-(ms[2]io[6]A)-hydroxylase [Salmonella enterica subsp. enterica]|uniref:tRNA-(Ms[2]io[6]A)-hydroxylase n=1 Tax=Salmonella enterica I TaxID=59201 RepID=A0A379V0G3_SALET|nr:tRNA-(ms[2]io[6]A)-hydroxylase [Salmonella enterica subsp. enterica]